MKTLEIELTDALAATVEELVEKGWFTGEAEVVRLALAEYLRHRPFELQERFLREDIAWALGQTGAVDDLKKRLRKDRPMTTVSLRMPEDVVQDLERIAPRLGFSGCLPLLRAYVGQGLRRDLETARGADHPTDQNPRPVRQRPPTHPGEILREDVLPELRLSVAEAARHLRVSRQRLHRLLAGSAPVTAEMALRLGRFCGNGPDLWLRMQQAHDLWHARERLGAELEAIPEHRGAHAGDETARDTD